MTRAEPRRALPRLPEYHMVNPEWGTKRACPKCNTRFYDLGQDAPATCINKSKQPLPFEAAAKPAPKTNEDGEIIEADDDDLDVAEDAEEPDVDIGEDEDLSVVVPGEDEDEA